MNKNTPLNQRYICSIGVDGTHITDATQLGLQSCVRDIYLMGIEDGRILEREVY